jgi:hypothetical protein
MSHLEAPKIQSVCKRNYLNNKANGELPKYLQQEGFRKGSADSNLYIKVTQDSILLIEVYVDDIIFRSIDSRLR